MNIDTATVRYTQRRRLGEYEHHEAEASFSLRPDAGGFISEQQVVAGMEQACQVVLGAIAGRMVLGAVAGKTVLKASDLGVYEPQPGIPVSAGSPVADAPKRGRPPKKAEAPAEKTSDPLADFVGAEKTPVAPTAPAANEAPAFSEEDLKKAAVAASGVITPLGVKAVIKEFGGVLLSTIPVDKRAAFIARLDAEVAKARGGK